MKRTFSAVLAAFPHSGLVGASLALVGALATPASAQLATVGSATPLLAPTVTRGSDAAFDPANNRFLAVGAYGAVTGIFVDINGTPLGAAFPIGSGGHANYPRAVYAPHLNGGNGGFLVTWSSEDGGGGNLNIHTRVLNLGGAPVGIENIVSDTSRAWLESAPAVAYSPTSQKFLVAWATLGLAIKARILDLSGAGVGNPVLLSASGFGRDPGVAWNPNRNEFGVSFSGEGSTGGFSVLAIVPAGNPEGFRRTTFNALGGGALTFITDLAYSVAAQRYIMTWYEAVKAKVAELDDDGNVLRNEVASFRIGVYDSLSLAYNPVTQTHLLAGLDPQTDRLTGAELNANGVRITPELSMTGGPAYYTRTAAATSSNRWLALISRQFVLTSIAAQTGGGGQQPPGVYVDVTTPAAHGQGVTNPFAVSGWAVDTRATIGPGIDVVHIYAVPHNGSPAVFLGTLPVNQAAPPNVTQTFGAQFGSAGWGTSFANLMPGAYTLVIYPHSTVTGQFDFNAVATRVITIGNGPVTTVDAPSFGANLIFGGLGQSIRGWAVNLGASGGTGINTVHVWVVNAHTGAATFIGGDYGRQRSDVAAAFGPQFLNSGFDVTISNPLATGYYYIIAYSHDTATGQFNYGKVWFVLVNGGGG